jgi:Carboxypeptidase regulatory-like domain
MERPQAYAAVSLVASTLLFPSCESANTPAQPTPPVVTPAPRVFSFSGGVMDTAYRPVGGSKVEVMNGARAGTVATTDEAGRFSMPGTFTDTITVIASKDGYLSSTRTVPLSPPDRLPPPMEGERWETYFHLEPLGSFVNIAGVYTMTLTADRTCTNLPDEARTRAYTATIVPAYPGSRTTFRATLSDALFYWTHNQAMFSTAGGSVRSWSAGAEAPVGASTEATGARDSSHCRTRLLNRRPPSDRYAFRNVSRSALIVSASVVGIPCGKPL